MFKYFVRSMPLFTLKDLSKVSFLLQIFCILCKLVWLESFRRSPTSVDCDLWNTIRSTTLWTRPLCTDSAVYGAWLQLAFSQTKKWCARSTSGLTHSFSYSNAFSFEVRKRRLDYSHLLSQNLAPNCRVNNSSPLGWCLLMAHILRYWSYRGSSCNFDPRLQIKGLFLDITEFLATQTLK